MDSHRGVSSGLVWVAMLALAGCGAGTAQPSAADAAEMANPRLSTGRSIKPEGIASQDVGSLPVNMIASADGQYAITSDGGYRQFIWTTRISDGVGVSNVPFPHKTGKTATTQEKSHGLYYGLALSPNEKFLYATLGDMNAVAVIDVPDKELEGYIPAGWYPTSVLVTPDGKRLLVANAKGTRSRYPNPPIAPKGKQTDPKRKENPNNLVEGNVITLVVPDKPQLKQQTEAVMAHRARYVRSSGHQADGEDRSRFAPDRAAAEQGADAAVRRQRAQRYDLVCRYREQRHRHHDSAASGHRAIARRRDADRPGAFAQ